MRKLISKIKKVVVAIVLAIISFQNKISAGVDHVPQALYGVARPSTVTIIWRIARIFIIPIAVLIGFIIYFKKSKSSKKKKILVTIGLTAIVVILYFVFDIIIYEFAL